jgi:exosome complex component RRP41
VRAAAINAAVLAIVDAGIPMKDTMAACSAGFLDDTALLDLNYMEVRIPISLGYFFD